MLKITTVYAITITSLWKKVYALRKVVSCYDSIHNIRKLPLTTCIMLLKKGSMILSNTLDFQLIHNLTFLKHNCKVPKCLIWRGESLYMYEKKTDLLRSTPETLLSVTLPSEVKWIATRDGACSAIAQHFWNSQNPPN